MKIGLLDNLHQKLLPKTRNFMNFRFGLVLIGAISFILAVLIILFTNSNSNLLFTTTSSVFYSYSRVNSWSFSLPNTSLASSSWVKTEPLFSNFSKEGNFSEEGKKVKSHVVDFEFGVKNVSFVGQESRNFTAHLSNFTAHGNFSEGKKVNLDSGVKNVSFVGQESRNITAHLSNFSKEGKKVNFDESGVKHASFIGEESRNCTAHGNFSKKGKKVNLDELGKNVSFIGEESRNITPHRNFSKEGKKVISDESGVKNASLIGEETRNITAHLSNFTARGNFSEGKKVNFDESGIKNVSLIGEETRNITTHLSNFTAHGNFSKEGKTVNVNDGKECDIFDGKWVKDEKLPHYSPGSCPLLDTDFNCYKNGRPDQAFYKWRWKPNFCNIPRLNATDFLERMKGKKLVFVGDSLNRNMWESLICILRHSLENKTRVHEISGKSEFKKQGFYAFRFEDYNCTIDYVRAPFLVRESSFQGSNGSFPTLRLDLMDKTTKMYHDADILIFNTGHWWTHEKTSKGEDYYQVGNYVYPRLEPLQAYRKALKTWGRWVDKNINTNKTLVFFRGYSVTHFRGGQWNSGGQCHKETEPIFNETYLGQYPPKMKVFEHVMKKMKTHVMYLNISRLTDYRKDAHPSIFRKSYENQQELVEAEKSQDCSHWCLPGVPDIWNELFYASLMKIGWNRRIYEV